MNPILLALVLGLAFAYDILVITDYYDLVNYDYLNKNHLHVFSIVESYPVYDKSLKSKILGKKSDFVLVSHGKESGKLLQTILGAISSTPDTAALSNIKGILLMQDFLHQKIPLDIPVLSIASDNFFQFALDSFKLQSSKNVYLLLNITDYVIDLIPSLLSEFLESRDLDLISQYNASTWSFSKNILEMLYLESHPSLKLPCSFYSDSNPRNVTEDCVLGNKWTQISQLVVSGIISPDYSLISNILKYSETGLVGTDRPREIYSTSDCKYKCVPGEEEYEKGKAYSVCSNALGRIEKCLTFNSVNEIHKTWIHFPTHLPKAKLLSENSVLIESVSENLYNQKNTISSYEVQGKLLSQQASLNALGLKKFSFFETDEGGIGGVGNSLCGQANNLSISVVETLLMKSKKSSLQYALNVNEIYQKYTEKGKRFYAGKDLGPTINGFTWIFWAPLEYRETGERLIEVRSKALMTSEEFIVKQAAGFHYCKLISPAYVLEWILSTQ